MLFFVVPLAWYFFTEKHIKGSFLKYIGLHKAPTPSYLSAVYIRGLAYLYTIFNFIILYLNGGMEISPLQEPYAISAPITFIFISIVFGLNAGICEEIFFRGFVGKRCIKKLGFAKGNALQAFIFVFPHFATFGTKFTFEVIAGIINAGIMGYAFGYIMNKKAGGSILPSIVVHTLVDIVAIPVSLFIL